MINLALMIDYDGGHLSKSINGSFLESSHEGNILSQRPLKETEETFDEKFISSPITGRFIAKNKYLDEVRKDFNSFIKGGYKTYVGDVFISEGYFNKFYNVSDKTEQGSGFSLRNIVFNRKAGDDILGVIKELLLDPDEIRRKKNGDYVFVLRKKGKTFSLTVAIKEGKGLIQLLKGGNGERVYSRTVEKGSVINFGIVENEQKVLIKSFGNIFKIGGGVGEDDKESSTGVAWNKKGGQKPNHKYIERRPNPKGEGYIYLYELPNGKRQWRDESGKDIKGGGDVKSENNPLNEFKKGDRIRQGDKIGTVLDTSPNLLAVSFDGKKKIIDKREYLQRVAEHKNYKEGDVVNYDGKELLLTTVTGRLAVARELDTNRLRVIELEQEIQRADEPSGKGRKKKEPAQTDYQNQEGYRDFDKEAKERGFGSTGDDLERKKIVKVGDDINTMRWEYDPEINYTRKYYNGVRDYFFNIGGQKLIISDISEDGYWLEDKNGNEYFMSYADKEKLDEEEKKKHQEFLDNVKVTKLQGGALLSNPNQKKYTFTPEYTEEEKQRFAGRRARGGSRWRKQPIQTEERKREIEEQNIENKKKVGEILAGEDYGKFKKFADERGYEIQTNKYRAKKEIDLAGKKFSFTAVYDDKNGGYKIFNDGKTKELSLGDKKYPIVDVQPDKVTYDDGGERRDISVENLKEINGKDLFAPTKSSKGIVSKDEPQKVYFGTDDKDSASVVYEVVEADDLIPSHLIDGDPNPDYTISDAQNRDRGSGASKNQINKIATNPIFDFVSDDKTAQNGAPIVNGDYNVIAGNGRALGLIEHYERNGVKYKNDLINNAERLGFSKSEIAEMRHPVLVRRTNIDNKEAQRLGALSNQDQKLALSDKETAKGFSTRIDEKTMDKISGMFQSAKGDYSSISDYLNDIGADIATELIKKGVIPDNEKHLYYDVENNRLNTSQKEKLKDVLTQTMLGDSTKNFDEIPSSAREGISKAVGYIFADMGKPGDLSEPLRGAVKLLSQYEKVKDRFGDNPDEYISQAANSMIDKLSADKKTLALFDMLATNKKPNEIKNKFNEYRLAREGDMFNPGLSDEDAFDEVFKPKYKEGINKSLLTRLFFAFREKLLKSGSSKLFGGDEGFEEKHPRDAKGRFATKGGKELKDAFERFKKGNVKEYRTPLGTISLHEQDFHKIVGLQKFGREAFGRMIREGSLDWDRLESNGIRDLKVFGYIEELLTKPDEIRLVEDNKLGAELVFILDKGGVQYFAAFTRKDAVRTLHNFDKSYVDKHTGDVIWTKEKGLIKSINPSKNYHSFRLSTASEFPRVKLMKSDFFVNDFVLKSIGSNRLELLPSKKNPNIKRWQKNNGGSKANFPRRKRFNHQKDAVGAFAEEAKNIAEKYHSGQKYNGEDYFNAHIEKVVKEAVKLVKKEKMTQSEIDKVRTIAYLHDVVEDTPVTIEEINNKFGAEIAKAVEKLTNRTEEGERKSKEYYFMEIGKSKLAKIVKAADRIVNLKGIDSIKDKQFKDKLANKYSKEMKFIKKYDIYASEVEKYAAD